MAKEFDYEDAFREKIASPVLTLQEQLTVLFRADVSATGSRVTCNPPVMDTDEDWLVLVFAPQLPHVLGFLSREGFNWEGSEHYQEAAADGFMSWRKDRVNLIINTNPDWAQKHKAATALCKRLNLLKKEDRVATFRAVLYGEAC